MHDHIATCLRGPVSQRLGLAWNLPFLADPVESGPNAGRETLMTQDPVQPANENADGIRAELVARIRSEIAAGTYDTPEKLEIALDRLLRRLETE